MNHQAEVFKTAQVQRFQDASTTVWPSTADFFFSASKASASTQDLDGKFEMLVDAVKEVETTTDDKVAKTLVFANSKCGVLDVFLRHFWIGWLFVWQIGYEKSCPVRQGLMDMALPTNCWCSNLWTFDVIWKIFEMGTLIPIITTTMIILTMTNNDDHQPYWKKN